MSADYQNAKFSTRAIHAHQSPDPVTGAVIPPLYQSSTFVQEDAGLHKGWDYTRTGNPTIQTLAKVIATLEGGKHGFCFGSGLGAFVTLCNALLKAGDHIVVVDNVYGGTFRYSTKVLKRFGVEVDFVDLADPINLKSAIKDSTKLIHLESPTNPLIKLVDIEAIAKIAKEAGITTSVDNTFASPYLQNPLAMGIDIVHHSTTKYIGGHSDVVGGALILKDDTYEEVIRFHRNTVGAIMDPFNAWLTLRGLKTLSLRMQKHCENALKIAAFLEQHDAVDRVVYPGLPSHPQHELATRQMKKGFGGMMAVYVKGGEAEARQLLKNTKLFILAESLGGVESLIQHPALMTHVSVDPDVRKKLGIDPNLVRVSVGIEDVDDLIADLDQALQTISSAKATV